MWQRLLMGVAALSLAAVVTGANAGELDDFEEEATETESGSSQSSEDASHNGHHGDGELAELGGVMFELIGLGIAYGGANSWHRASETLEPEQVGDEYPGRPRRPGEAGVPFVRLDVAHHNIRNAQAQAVDSRFEGGYGPFALQLHHTHFDEDDPNDKLDLIRGFALYRMSFGSAFEWDLGGGPIFIEGEGSNTGGGFTSPVLFHPARSWGLEYRPAWFWVNGNQIAEHDVAVLVGWDYVSVKLGYRWLETDGEELNGPYTGLSVRF